MARIDDFKQARAISINELQQYDPELIAEYSGAEILKADSEVKSLKLDFLNRDITISWPDMEISCEDDKGEIPIQQQALILHYLSGTYAAKGVAVSGEWISYQDIPDGRFYMDAFIKRAKTPLIQTFGFKGAAMINIAAEAYNASKLDLGDYSVRVVPLPFVPAALLIWEGDEEFPPDGNLLFDKTIQEVLSAEDIAALAGMVVYPMIGMAYR